MKNIKRKILCFLAISLVGLTLMITNSIDEMNSMAFGLGSALLVIGLIKGIQLYKVSKDKEKLKQYEMIQNEERLKFISNKSSSLTWYITLFVQYIAMIVLTIMKQYNYASLISYITSIQVLIYLCSYYVFNKRY